jgi:hypothetical protein
MYLAPLVTAMLVSQWPSLAELRRLLTQVWRKPAAWVDRALLLFPSKAAAQFHVFPALGKF